MAACDPSAVYICTPICLFALPAARRTGERMDARVLLHGTCPCRGWGGSPSPALRERWASACYSTCSHWDRRCSGTSNDLGRAPRPWVWCPAFPIEEGEVRIKVGMLCIDVTSMKVSTLRGRRSVSSHLRATRPIPSWTMLNDVRIAGLPTPHFSQYKLHCGAMEAWSQRCKTVGFCEATPRWSRGIFKSWQFYRCTVSLARAGDVSLF